MTRKQAAECFRRAGSTPPADISEPDASKFSSRAKTVDGKKFQSTLEAEAYLVLRAWLQMGAITKLETQPAFVVQEKFRDGEGMAHRAIKYLADFRIRYKDGAELVIDTKGAKTDMYRLKLKLFKRRYPDVRFEEWTRETLRAM